LRNNSKTKLDSTVSYKRKLLLCWRRCVDRSAGPGFAALHGASSARNSNADQPAGRVSDCIAEGIGL